MVIDTDILLFESPLYRTFASPSGFLFVLHPCAGHDKEPEKKSLGKLYEHFKQLYSDIAWQLNGGMRLRAHQAIGDVDMLAFVLYCALLELKVPLSTLLSNHTKSVKEFFDEASRQETSPSLAKRAKPARKLGGSFSSPVGRPRSFR